jgi:phosphotransferase system HPr-like phosphotransfer protein
MKTIELEIRNTSGLHARPAALFVRTAGANRSREPARADRTLAGGGRAT